MSPHIAGIAREILSTLWLEGSAAGTAFLYLAIAIAPFAGIIYAAERVCSRTQKNSLVLDK